LEYKKKIEFWEKEFNEIDTHCKKLGIMWFASPWDTESVDFLGKYNPPCYKIPSALLTHEEYLQHLKRTGKPIIMSTGMSTLEQIDQAVRILSDQSLAVLHCTSKYPCAMEELNLKCIDMLRKRYPHVVIGYSGHEPGVLPSVVAVAAHGATIIERHVTLNRSMWGTDHASSLERKGMENLIRDIRNLNRMQGDGQKQIYDSELPVIEKLRKN
jgi:N-acetylneuraminate synthase